MSDKYPGKRRSPLKAIRAFCVWCCGGSAPEVQLCPSASCAFYPYRMGTIPPGASRGLMKAFKARCLECAADHDPANCDAFQKYEIHPPCPVWPYRLGKNPNIGMEQREKLRGHGKRLMNFASPRPEIEPRINPNRESGGFICP